MQYDKNLANIFYQLTLLKEKMLQEQKSSTKYDVMYFQGEWTSQTAGGCGNDTIGNISKDAKCTTYFLFYSKFCEEPTICLHSL